MTVFCNHQANPIDKREMLKRFLNWLEEFLLTENYWLNCCFNDISISSYDLQKEKQLD